MLCLCRSKKLATGDCLSLGSPSWTIPSPRESERLLDDVTRIRLLCVLIPCCKEKITRHPLFAASSFGALATSLCEPPTPNELQLSMAPQKEGTDFPKSDEREKQNTIPRPLNPRSFQRSSEPPTNQQRSSQARNALRIHASLPHGRVESEL